MQSHITIETFTFPNLNLVTKTELVVWLCEHHFLICLHYDSHISISHKMLIFAFSPVLLTLTGVC